MKQIINPQNKSIKIIIIPVNLFIINISIPFAFTQGTKRNENVGCPELCLYNRSIGNSVHYKSRGGEWAVYVEAFSIGKTLMLMGWSYTNQQ